MKADKILMWIAAAGIAAYFLYFAIPAMQAGFAPDDPMNAGEYWLRGFWRSVADIFMFWSTAYRPLGAMFYLPIYHFFGFSPVPFRVAALALIAGNVLLTYGIALLLTESRAASALAAMLLTAHASMVAIYFNTSMIYDILAYFFTALTLFLYLRFRRQGHPLSFGQSALVTGAFIAALDSKELAVVASGWVLAYELLFRRPWRLRLPVFLCLLSLVYTIGKFLGPNPLAKEQGYLLDFSWHRYFLNNRVYWNDLFYSHWFTTSRRLVFCWLALTAICWIARRLELWWCWFLVTTATLGISFTIQSRGASGLYLPLLGWALMAASLLVAPFRKSPLIGWAVATALALYAGSYTIGYWRPQPQGYFDWHSKTLTTLSQIEGVPKPPPRSRVLFLHDPWEGYDTLFMALLVWDDHSLTIDLDRKMTTPPDPAKYDWVLSFEDGGLRVLKQ